jgi:hypothetical protein
MSTPERLCVTGSRTWVDRSAIEKVLRALHPDSTLIHGGCPTGADQIANELAEDIGLKIHIFHADWRTWGKAAGFIRNREMIEKGQPDRVVAFQKSMSRGTQSTIDIARERGIPVEVLRS